MADPMPHDAIPAAASRQTAASPLGPTLEELMALGLKDQGATTFSLLFADLKGWGGSDQIIFCDLAARMGIAEKTARRRVERLVKLGFARLIESFPRGCRLQIAEQAPPQARRGQTPPRATRADKVGANVGTAMAPTLGPTLAPSAGTNHATESQGRARPPVATQNAAAPTETARHVQPDLLERSISKTSYLSDRLPKPEVQEGRPPLPISSALCDALRQHIDPAAVRQREDGFIRWATNHLADPEFRPHILRQALDAIRAGVWDLDGLTDAVRDAKQRELAGKLREPARAWLIRVVQRQLKDRGWGPRGRHRLRDPPVGARPRVAK